MERIFVEQPLVEIGLCRPERYRRETEKLLRPAIAYGTEESWEAVRKAIDTGEAQLWLAMEENKPIAAAVTRITVADVCEFWFAGGDDGEKWIDQLIGIVSNEARQLGLKSLRIIGREGWKRRLRDWKVQAVILEKDL